MNQANQANESKIKKALELLDLCENYFSSPGELFIFSNTYHRGAMAQLCENPDRSDLEFHNCNSDFIRSAGRILFHTA